MNSQLPMGRVPKPLPLPNRHQRGTGHWRTPQQGKQPAK